MLRPTPPFQSLPKVTTGSSIIDSLGERTLLPSSEGRTSTASYNLSTSLYSISAVMLWSALGREAPQTPQQFDRAAL